MSKKNKHGLSKHPLYKTWNNITQRVKSNKYYVDISVCDEWYNFFNFYTWCISNGWNEKLTIDRIDNKGNYEPSNCRWISHKEQMNNTRRNRTVKYNGQSKNIAQWCEELGLNRNTVVKRLNSGFPPELAFKKGYIISEVRKMKKKKKNEKS